jgi:hypothetical protein
MSKQAKSSMTIDDVIAQNPWMEVFRKQLHEKCPDCAVTLGEHHIEGCDIARCSECGGQRLGCGCEKGTTDQWTGIVFPNIHKKCVEHDLWSRDFLIHDGVFYPVDQHSNMGFLFVVVATSIHSPRQYSIVLSENKRKVKVKSPFHDTILDVDSETMLRFCEAISAEIHPTVATKMHIPCKQEDEGADADLNRAARFRSESAVRKPL